MKFLSSMTDKILKGLGLLSGSFSSATEEMLISCISQLLWYCLNSLAANVADMRPTAECQCRINATWTCGLFQ